MDVTKLNFFQKQYLTYFRHESAKPKAAVYHAIIQWVMDKHYAPTINDLARIFPTRKKTLLTDLRYLEKKGFLTKTKIGMEFFLFPVLRPFVIFKESQDKVYSNFSESPEFERGLKLRDKLNEILDARKQHHKTDWRASFKEAGYSDDPSTITKKTADEYDRAELPPHFDDAENSSGLVVV